LCAFEPVCYLPIGTAIGYSDAIRAAGTAAAAIMAKDTGKGSRKGAVTARTQSKNPKTGDYTKRNETPGSKKKGPLTESVILPQWRPEGWQRQERRPR
jgi:hypothetical protein